ncbi:MAG TPA: DNA polymerase Y family protein [Thermomicrobiales bacterium]|nr:DNA polymerase Y family protein [Thermomicrobiales bacterium]
MSIACLFVPHFALRVALLERPELDGAPLVLGSPPERRPLVRDATPEAAARGIRPGLNLREVTALCPDAIVVAPHPLREAAAAERLLADLERLSPVVERDDARAGVWFVDLRGSARLLGEPHIAGRRLLAAAPELLRPRLGVAPSRFAAWVAAQDAPPGGSRVIPSAAVANALAPAPVALLPLPPETIRRLERLGLRTLGDLAALPPTAVQARFGATGRRMWTLARGEDDTPVRPGRQPEIVSEWLDLPAPATSQDALLVAAARLALRAFGRPALHCRHVRQARLRAALEDGAAWEQIATLREPGGARRVIDALGYRIRAAMLPGPVTALTLDLVGPVDVAGRQDLLPGFHARRPRRLAEACRQLKQRFGSSCLYRVIEVEPWSRIPERRQALIAFEP